VLPLSHIPAWLLRQAPSTQSNQSHVPAWLLRQATHTRSNQSHAPAWLLRQATYTRSNQSHAPAQSCVGSQSYPLLEYEEFYTMEPSQDHSFHSHQSHGDLSIVQNHGSHPYQTPSAPHDYGLHPTQAGSIIQNVGAACIEGAAKGTIFGHPVAGCIEEASMQGLIEAFKPSTAY
jgi:hypothetical protein